MGRRGITPEEIARLKALGWKITSIHVPPTAREIMDECAAAQGLSRSTFIWRLCVGVWLKAMGAKPEESVVDVRVAMSPQRSETARVRIKALLDLAKPESKHLSKASQALYDVQRNKERRLKEAMGAAGADFEEDITTGDPAEYGAYE